MNYHSIIFSKYLGDEQMLRLVSDDAMISKLLQFEIALAKSQSVLGIIPVQAAAEIEKTIGAQKIQPADLTAGVLQNGIPVVGLVELLKDKLPEGKSVLKLLTYIHNPLKTGNLISNSCISRNLPVLK